MLRQLSAIALSILMIHAAGCLTPALAGSKEDKQALRATEVKAGILKLGVGSDARVALKLRDNQKLAGFITEASSDSFVLKDVKTGTSTTVPYRDVVQARGHNISTGAKIAIGIGIGVGLTILVLYLIFMNYQD